MRTRLVATLATLVLTGCASHQPISVRTLPEREEMPVYGSFPHGYPAVWDAVTEEVAASWGAPVLSAERPRGVVLADWRTGRSERFVDGRGVAVESRRKLEVRLTSNGDLVSVRIVTDEQILRDGEWIPVSSGTTAEIELLERIHRRVQRLEPEQCRVIPGWPKLRHADYGDCRIPGPHKHNVHSFAGTEHVCPTKTAQR